MKMNNIQLVMRKCDFENGELNPWKCSDEEIITDVKEDFEKIIDYIQKQSTKYTKWSTRFFFVEKEDTDILPRDLQRLDVTRTVVPYLESRGFHGELTGEAEYVDSVELVMYKEILSKYGNRKGSCDYTVIQDLDAERVEILKYILTPSPVGRWSETAFRLVLRREYPFLNSTDSLMTVEVTDIVEDYLGVEITVVDKGSIFKDTPVRC